MNELSSIKSGIISLRSSTLLEVIPYGDKIFSDNSNSKNLLRLSITLRIRNGLNSPYFKYLNFENPFYQLATNFLDCF